MNSFIFSFKLSDNVINSDTSEIDKIIFEKHLDVAELHVNLWKTDSGNIIPRKRFYYDFGIKFRHSIEYICVYIPFEIEDNAQDFDLVRKLRTNNSLLCTVFNRVYKLEDGLTDSYARVIPADDNTSVKSSATSEDKYDGKMEDKHDTAFYLHQLGSSKFEVVPFIIGENRKKKTIGTILKISIQDKPYFNENFKNNQESFIYIRFRIQPKRMEDVIRSEHVSNDFFQSAFSMVDLIDFRANEVRNFNNDVRDKILNEGFKFFKFDKVHLFFMAESKEKIDNGSALKIDSRLLEKELWADYLPKDCHDCNYIAHHWKKRQPKTIKTIEGNTILEKIEYESFGDYRIFFTSTYPKLQLYRLMVYLFVVILLGFIGSMLSFGVSTLVGFSISSCWKVAIVTAMMLYIIIFFFTGFRLIIRLIRK